MGDLYQTLGKVPEARGQYQKMRTITQTLLDREPLSAANQRNESTALALVGDTHLLLGDPARARDEYEKALDIRRKLADADPENPTRKVDLAQIYTKLGDASPPADARTYHAEALALREALADGATGQAARAARRDVWVSRLRLAELGLRARDLAAAREHAAECVTIAGELAAQNSTVRSRLDQAISLCKLGLVLKRSGKPADAQRQFATALKLLKLLAERDPQNLAVQFEYALTLAHAGRHAEAAAMASRLRERVGTNPNYLYNLACSYAECEAAAGPPAGAVAGAAAATRLGYAEKALAALRDAVRGGFRDAGLARIDPDFDPVRGRPEFAAILTSIPAPKPRAVK
jgi:tetratricopeptide (TPR) repeat protein